MGIRTSVCLLLVACAAAVGTSCRKPIPTAPDREDIAKTVAAFHQALATGDREAAMELLADDAQILESGHRQTREEYAHEHLAADIAFAKAVPNKRSAMIVRQQGDVAWASVTGRSLGEFKGKPISAETAELMVLARTDKGWRIRAIHWSTHESTGPGGH
jgi:ketosteroid isomerase-like protein